MCWGGGGGGGGGGGTDNVATIYDCISVIYAPHAFQCCNINGFHGTMWIIDLIISICLVQKRDMFCILLSNIPTVLPANMVNCIEIEVIQHKAS